MHTFKIGFVTTVQTTDINQLRDEVEIIRNMANELATDLPKHLSDFCFSVETEYQRHHGLDENCFDIVNKYGLVNIASLKAQTECEIPDDKLKKLIQDKFGEEMTTGEVSFMK